MNTTFSVYLFALFIYFAIKIEGTARLLPSVASAFVVLKSTSGALNSVPTNKSVYLYAKCGHLKVVREPN